MPMKTVEVQKTRLQNANPIIVVWIYYRHQVGDLFCWGDDKTYCKFYLNQVLNTNGWRRGRYQKAWKIIRAHF